MEHMTKILSEPQQKIRYIKPPSLNETERKLKTDLINLDNKLLVERLKKVPPVIDIHKMTHDFERHLKLGAHMRKKFPGQTHKASPAKSKAIAEDSLDGGISILGMGSSSQIFGDQGPALNNSGMGIDSISEFRRQVIHRKSGGGVTKLEKISTIKQNNGINSGNSGGSVESVYEMTHDPQSAGTQGDSQVRFAN
jgi:hypothetical protein